MSEGHWLWALGDNVLDAPIQVRHQPTQQQAQAMIDAANSIINPPPVYTENDIFNFIDPDLQVLVELPQGQIGAPEELPMHDPVVVGAAAFDPSLKMYTMLRDWDYQKEGGVLNFGYGRIDGNQYIIDGAYLEAASGGGGVMFDGSFRHTTVVGVGDVVECVDGMQGGTEVSHCAFLNITGDIFKGGRNTSMSITDCFASAAVSPTTTKHQDGIQVHDARTGANGGHVYARRLVIDWRNGGTKGGTTAPIFLEGSSYGDLDDILVLNPGGTWSVMRSSHARHTLGEIQIIGEQLPNYKDPSKLAPRELIWGPARWRNVINDVPNTQDYKDA